MPIRILIVANTGWYVNNFRRSTILAFLARGDYVAVICPENTSEELLEDLDVQVKTFPLDGAGTNPLVELRSLFSIIMGVKAISPDVVFTFNPKTNLYGLLSCTILCIPCIPNVSGVGNASQLAGWKGMVYRALSKVAYGRATKVFFQNDADRDLFHQLGVLERVPHQCLPGSGIDLLRYAPLKRNPTRPFRFFLACRLIRQKGIMEYLEAASIVAKATNRVVEFWLAGVPDNSARGVSEMTIRKFVDNKAIQFLGQVNDMASVISKVDCAVLPTYYPEGVPRFLLEGAAAGKVLITTDRPGCRDVIEPGENGYFVLPESVESLVSMMEQVLSLPDSDLERMGFRSREIAVKKFDEQLVLNAYLEAADRALFV